MDSRLIEQFLRVAELGSINKAAADLRLSQPAISRNIALLEHQIRAKLFTRSRGGVTLTDAGEFLFERARPLLKQLASLAEEVGDRAAGHLAIGLPPSWQALFTAQYVPRLARAFPGISLRLYEGSSHELRERMRAGALDLAIMLFEGAPPQGCSHTALVREPVVLAAHKGASIAPDKPLPLSRLDNLGLALPDKSNSIRAQVENSLERKGFRFNILFEIQSMELSIELARQGVCQTVVPCCAISGNPRWEKAVAWSAIRGMFITWALCENTARSHSPAVREGRRLAEKLVDEVIAGGKWRGAERLFKA
jgi:LysR family nitrogen assimilation transcriptional regulator